MQPKHQKTIDGYANGLTTLSNLLNKYQVPDCFNASIDNDGCVELYHYMSKYSGAEERNRNLLTIKAAFGTDDWTAVQTSICEYRWERTIDDVKIIVSGAQVMPDPLPQPVPVKAWPIQLMDATA